VGFIFGRKRKQRSINMTDKTTGGPAFPWGAGFAGMTLRDYFAAKAMQGMLANPKLQEQILKVGQSWIEESAYAVADAMLEVRGQ
jgi:hypothetical protein